MAGGLLAHLGGERFEVFSAGTEATLVRPLAIKAMAELGIDIAGQQSKTLDRYLDKPFDEVITVCDTAAEACPIFPGAAQRQHAAVIVLEILLDLHPVHVRDSHGFLLGGIGISCGEPDAQHYNSGNMWLAIARSR